MEHKYNIEQPESNSGGVYMLYNLNNHKVYIGQTKKFRQRAQSHKQSLEAGTHSNKKLQEDYNSGCDFAFVILEDCGADCDLIDLRIKEMQYIWVYLNKYVKLYNIDTREHITDRLFSEMVRPILYDVERKLTKKLGNQLASMCFCKPETLIRKFSNLQ